MPVVPTLADVRDVEGCVAADADVAVVAGVTVALVAGVAVLGVCVSGFTVGVTNVAEEGVTDGADADEVVAGVAVGPAGDVVSATKRLAFSYHD